MMAYTKIRASLNSWIFKSSDSDFLCKTKNNKVVVTQLENIYKFKNWMKQIHYLCIINWHIKLYLSYTSKTYESKDLQNSDIINKVIMDCNMQTINVLFSRVRAHNNRFRVLNQKHTISCRSLTEKNITIWKRTNNRTWKEKN